MPSDERSQTFEEWKMDPATCSDLPFVTFNDPNASRLAYAAWHARDAAFAQVEKERDQAKRERDTLCAKFSDLAVEMEKHSNDHLHAFLSSDRQSAAVEGVCADRIKSIVAELRGKEVPIPGLAITVGHGAPPAASPPSWHRADSSGTSTAQDCGSTRSGTGQPDEKPEGRATDSTVLVRSQPPAPSSVSEIVRECHAARLRGDLEYILKVEAKKRLEPNRDQAE